VKFSCFAALSHAPMANMFAMVTFDWQIWSNLLLSMARSKEMVWLKVASAPSALNEGFDVACFSRR